MYVQLWPLFARRPTRMDRSVGWRGDMNYAELPLSNLYLTMLQRLGVETESFGGSTGTLSEVFGKN